VAVARAAHPLAAKKKLVLADLVRWPWILQPHGSPQRSPFESALREAGLHTRLDITETASTVATTVLLAASDMIAIMPASLAAHYAQLGVLRPLPIALPLQVPSIHLVTRRHRELTPVAQGFIEVLRGMSGFPAVTGGGLGPPRPTGEAAPRAR
jgi:DNA-binding transcriptional LysR family regulator